MAPQSVPGAEQMTGRAPQPFGSYPFFVAPGKRAATPLQTDLEALSRTHGRGGYTASGHPTPEGVRHRRVAMSPIGVGGWAPEARYWVCGFEACDGFETISKQGQRGLCRKCHASSCDMSRARDANQVGA